MAAICYICRSFSILKANDQIIFTTLSRHHGSRRHLRGLLPTEAAPGKTASDKSLKAAYYRQKYPDPHIDAHLRLAYLDSLIALRPSDIEGLLEKKIELCYERGLYSEVI